MDFQVQFNLGRFFGKKAPKGETCRFTFVKSGGERNPDAFRCLEGRLIYLLSLFPGKWATDLVKINSILASSRHYDQKMEMVARKTRSVIDKHADHCRRVLSLLRRKPQRFVKESGTVQWALLQTAKNTDFLYPDSWAPYGGEKTIGRLLENQIRYPWSPANIVMLSFSLAAWSKKKGPAAPWEPFLATLRRKKIINLSDAGLAASGACLVRNEYPKLASALIRFAKSTYASLEESLNREAAVFHNIDYQHLPPLNAFLAVPAKQASRRLETDLFPNLLTRAAHSLPNLGDRYLNEQFENNLLQRSQVL